MKSRVWETILTALATAGSVAMLATTIKRGYSFDKFGAVIAPWGHIALFTAIVIVGCVRLWMLFSTRNTDDPSASETALVEKWSAWPAWETFGTFLLMIACFAGAATLPLPGSTTSDTDKLIRYGFSFVFTIAGVVLLHKLLKGCLDWLPLPTKLNVTLSVRNCPSCGRSRTECECQPK